MIRVSIGDVNCHPLIEGADQRENCLFLATFCRHRRAFDGDRGTAECGASGWRKRSALTLAAMGWRRNGGASLPRKVVRVEASSSTTNVPWLWHAASCRNDVSCSRARILVKAYFTGTTATSYYARKNGKNVPLHRLTRSDPIRWVSWTTLVPIRLRSGIHMRSSPLIHYPAKPSSGTAIGRRSPLSGNPRR